MRSRKSEWQSQINEGGFPIHLQNKEIGMDDEEGHLNNNDYFEPDEFVIHNNK